MFSKRTLLDFLFFTGIFFIVDGLLSSWNFLFFGGVVYENGVPLTEIQYAILIIGILLLSASAICMFLFFKPRISDGSVLPSRRLFVDFIFIMGTFLGITALSYATSICYLFCSYPDTAQGLFLIFASPILLGTSIFLWRRERRISLGQLGHRLGWEIFSTVSISAFLVNLYIFSQGFTLSIVLAQDPVPYGFLTACLLSLTLGLYLVSREERKLGSAFDPLEMSFSARGLKKYLLIMLFAALVASNGITLAFAASENSNPCGAWETFGCNVRVVTVSSLDLYGGTTATRSSPSTAKLTMQLNNPDARTTISSLSVFQSGSSNFSQILLWSSTSDGKSVINFEQPYFKGAPNALNSSSANSFVFYPFTYNSTEIIATNQTYDYVLAFANGQQISGQILAS